MGFLFISVDLAPLGSRPALVPSLHLRLACLLVVQLMG